ncbi:MAG TPA: DinB family protein [Chitinophagaceae bacterium]|nr:DinB family protein [Chitinophagaceae bacterium]
MTTVKNQIIERWRMHKLKAFAKKLSMPLISFQKDESPPKKLLLEAFEQSGMVIEKYLEQCISKEGKATNFKSGVVAMLGYYISHEAHHRGNILLSMKQCGFKISDELKWGIWDMMRK